MTTKYPAPRTSYEHGYSEALEAGTRAIMAISQKLSDAKRDSDEWREQHENLLAMYRAAEQRAFKAEAELRACREANCGGWKRGEQRIVCAAVQDDAGRIVTGARHFDAVMMEQIKRSPHPEAWRGGEQGFIDQFGTFLNREEAFAVAQAQGQILDPDACTAAALFSEGLY